MGLSKISTLNKKKEESVLNDIYNSIDSNENIIFSSGAGSGKTYALIECLKYIIKKYGKTLKIYNQKVMCITFTNIATEEIKEKRGNTELIKVSTIHERIWELIKNHQKELVEIHKKKLVEEIKKLNGKIENNSKFKVFRELDSNEKDSFRNIMIDKKNCFYDNYNKSAQKIRDVFKNKLSEYPNILKNISKFKKIVRTLYKIDKYKNCLKNIDSEKENYNRIQYDSYFNRDRLHKMSISHETVLDYGLELIEKYDLLQKIIIDQYPYVLIDEYQDTNKKVIKIMKILSDEASEIEHNFFVGYFGDTAQNIYDEGVGNNINRIHPHLKQINKEFNRRSTKEIIHVINKIRNDKINQVSIYDDSEGGSVRFYTGKKKEISKFINKYSEKWEIDGQNKLHCLLLTNKLVAKYSNFINIYDCFKNTEYYKRYYQQINTEILSNDLSKLGEIPLLIFKIIQFKNNLENIQTSVTEILHKDLYTDMSINELRDLIKLLEKIKGDNLKEYVKSIFFKYNNTENKKYRNLISEKLGIRSCSYKEFYNYVLRKLYPDVEDEKLEEANDNIEKLFKISLNEYDSWYNFILREQKGEVIYHTYHGTKGLEFNNVIIIMENDFGRDREFFSSFFKNYNNIDKVNYEESKLKQARNLLYVSCSRTIKNLRILYLNDVSEFRGTIEDIFGKIYCYGDESN